MGAGNSEVYKNYDEIVFNVEEEFVPFVIQIIFYDKILDRCSIHHYQL